MRALWAHGLPRQGELGEAHHTHQVRHAAGWLEHTPSYVRACVVGAGASGAQLGFVRCRCHRGGEVQCAGVAASPLFYPGVAPLGTA